MNTAPEAAPGDEKHYGVLYDETQEVYLVRPGTPMFEAMSGVAAPDGLADGSVVSEAVSAEKTKRQEESEDYIAGEVNG